MDGCFISIVRSAKKDMYWISKWINVKWMIMSFLLIDSMKEKMKLSKCYSKKRSDWIGKNLIN